MIYLDASAVEVPRAVERVTSAPEALARIDELLERIDIRVLDREGARELDLAVAEPR